MNETRKKENFSRRSQIIEISLKKSARKYYVEVKESREEFFKYLESLSYKELKNLIKIEAKPEKLIAEDLLMLAKIDAKRVALVINKYAYKCAENEYKAWNYLCELGCDEKVFLESDKLDYTKVSVTESISNDSEIIQWPMMSDTTIKNAMNQDILHNLITQFIEWNSWRYHQNSVYYSVINELGIDIIDRNYLMIETIKLFNKGQKFEVNDKTFKRKFVWFTDDDTTKKLKLTAKAAGLAHELSDNSRKIDYLNLLKGKAI